jgi:hypothetical protein
MIAMLGFSLDFWDFVTFAVLFVAGLGFMAVVVLMMGLPGKIAIERKHPDAEAVRLMGYLGFMAVVPWIQAVIRAFKPTDIVDIRRFPKEEQRAIEANIAEMKGESPPPPPPATEG